MDEITERITERLATLKKSREQLITQLVAHNAAIEELEKILHPDSGGNESKCL